MQYISNLRGLNSAGVLFFVYLAFSYIWFWVSDLRITDMIFFTLQLRVGVTFNRALLCKKMSSIIKNIVFYMRSL